MASVATSARSAVLLRSLRLRHLVDETGRSGVPRPRAGTGQLAMIPGAHRPLESTLSRGGQARWRPFYGRRLRTLLPSARTVEFDRDGFETARDAYREQMVKSARGRPLKPLVLGQTVHVQDVAERSWSFATGVVTKALPNGRSYQVTTDAGIFRRNRRHLRPAPTLAPTSRVPETPPELSFLPSAPTLPRRSERIRKKCVSFA